MPELIIAAKWHPQGNGLLISGRAGMEEWGLWVYDANLQVVRFFPNPSPVSVSWSPDGTRFDDGPTGSYFYRHDWFFFHLPDQIVIPLSDVYVNRDWNW